MINHNDIPANLTAVVEPVKFYYVYCIVDSGHDRGKFSLATFFKKEAAFDYVSYLNENLVDDMFIKFIVEEECYEEI